MVDTWAVVNAAAQHLIYFNAHPTHKKTLNSVLGGTYGYIGTGKGRRGSVH